MGPETWEEKLDRWKSGWNEELERDLEEGN